MHPHRMSNFLSFRSLFETREQRIVRLANAGRFDKLIEMGVEPEHLEWLMHRGQEVQAEIDLAPEIQMSTPAVQAVEAA